MFRLMSSVVAALLVVAAPAHAHFVFVVPDGSGAKAAVVMSEDLKPDSDVDIAVIAGAKLSLREGAASKPLAHAAAKDALTLDIPAGLGTRVIHGVADLGVTRRGGAKPHVLVYHPKTILGDAFDPKATLGADVVPVEIVPTGKPGALVLQVLARGKPLANVDVNLVLPDG
jgi:hypothetical protein